MADLFKGWEWPKKYMPKDKSIQLDALEGSEDKFKALFTANAPMHFQQVNVNSNVMAQVIGTWPNSQQQWILRGWIIDMKATAANTVSSNIGVTAYIDNKSSTLSTWYPYYRYVVAGTAESIREVVTDVCIPLKPGTGFKGVQSGTFDNNSSNYLTWFYNVVEAI